MTDEVVTRLYRCLVEELRHRGHPEGQPVKVADLYQELVPYRAVRSALDVELNADYEHALLRLLAGERGLLRLEPDEARAELRKEVEAPYPFVGMFRKFSASDVWITMPRSDARSAPPPGPEPAPESAPPAARVDDAAPAPAPRTSPPAPSSPATAGPPRIAAVATSAVPAPLRLDPTDRDAEHPLHPATRCAFCEDELPAGRRVRFCPFCGGDQRLRPCPKCQAVLERDWRYCISCGHENAG